MKALVFHRIAPTFVPAKAGHRASVREIEEEFEFAATIEFSEEDAALPHSELLEIAFMKTNHMRCAWWDTGDALVKKVGGKRSTSVGDYVAIVNEVSGEATTYCVDRIGFLKV